MQMSGPTLPEGRKNESVETGRNEIERPITLANPISNSSSSARSLARSNHVPRRCAILAKKILIFPSLITLGIRRNLIYLRNRNTTITTRMFIIKNSQFSLMSNNSVSYALLFVLFLKLIVDRFQRGAAFAKTDWKTSMKRIEGIIIYRKSTIVPFRQTHCRIKSFCRGECLRASNALVRVSVRPTTVRPFLFLYGFDVFLPPVAPNESTFPPNRQNKSSRA